MMQVTDKAKSLLKDAMESNNQAPGMMFRLMVDDNQLAVGLAPKEDGDVVYEKEGIAVLAAPTEVLELLGERTIDVEDTTEGPRLVLTDNESDELA
jgi:hypothetical protein